MGDEGGRADLDLDLFDRGWTLLTADDDWTSAAASAREALGVDLKTQRPGADFDAKDQDELLRAFGLTRSGASLVRPDGHVAWRRQARDAETSTDLTSALRDALAASSFAVARAR